MRTLVTLALAAGAAAPAAAQTVHVPGTYSSPVTQGGATVVVGQPYPSVSRAVVVTAPRTYVAVRPRVAYSYSPVTYPQPGQTVVSSSWTYTTPVPTTQPSVTFSMPATATVFPAPTATYLPAASVPTYSVPMATTYTVPSTATYSAPVTTTYPQPVIYSQPVTSWSVQPVMTSATAWTPPQLDWYQPRRGGGAGWVVTGRTWGTTTPGWQPARVDVVRAGAVRNNPVYQPRATFRYAPAGNYSQRLLAPTASPQPGYAVRPAVTGPTYR